MGRAVALNRSLLEMRGLGTASHGHILAGDSAPHMTSSENHYVGTPESDGSSLRWVGRWSRNGLQADRRRYGCPSLEAVLGLCIDNR